MIAFDALGEPITQGSMVPYQDLEGRMRERHANEHELRRWRSTVANTARVAMRGAGPFAPYQPVEIDIEFRIPRPENGRGGRVLGLPHPTQDNDADKLSRAVFDALTGVAVHDDGQFTRLAATKRYCEPGELPGATIRLRSVEVAGADTLGGVTVGKTAVKAASRAAPQEGRTEGRP